MVSERCFNFTTVLLGWSHISKDLFAWRDYFLVQLLLCAPAHLLYRNENTHRELFNESVKISINSNRCIVNFHWQSLIALYRCSHCVVYYMRSYRHWLKFNQRNIWWNEAISSPKLRALTSTCSPHTRNGSLWPPFKCTFKFIENVHLNNLENGN